MIKMTQVENDHGKQCNGFHNNIFISKGNVLLVDIKDSAASIHFSHNAFWSIDDRPLFPFGEKFYYSFEQWRRETGYKNKNNRSTGLCVNPDIIWTCINTAVGYPRSLFTLSNFRLLPGSLLFNAVSRLTSCRFPNWQLIFFMINCQVKVHQVSV